MNKMIHICVQKHTHTHTHTHTDITKNMPSFGANLPVLDIQTSSSFNTRKAIMNVSKAWITVKVWINLSVKPLASMEQGLTVVRTNPHGWTCSHCPPDCPHVAVRAASPRVSACECSALSLISSHQNDGTTGYGQILQDRTCICGKVLQGNSHTGNLKISASYKPWGSLPHSHIPSIGSQPPQPVIELIKSHSL
jgi:hypothetical protein